MIAIAQVKAAVMPSRECTSLLVLPWPFCSPLLERQRTQIQCGVSLKGNIHNSSQQRRENTKCTEEGWCLWEKWYGWTPQVCHTNVNYMDTEETKETYLRVTSDKCETAHTKLVIYSVLGTIMTLLEHKSRDNRNESPTLSCLSVSCSCLCHSLSFFQPCLKIPDYRGQQLCASSLSFQIIW